MLSSNPSHTSHPSTTPSPSESSAHPLPPTAAQIGVSGQSSSLSATPSSSLSSADRHKARSSPTGFAPVASSTYAVPSPSKESSHMKRQEFSSPPEALNRNPSGRHGQTRHVRPVLIHRPVHPGVQARLAEVGRYLVTRPCAADQHDVRPILAASCGYDMQATRPCGAITLPVPPFVKESEPTQCAPVCY